MLAVERWPHDLCVLSLSCLQFGLPFDPITTDKYCNFMEFIIVSKKNLLLKDSVYPEWFNGKMVNFFKNC